MKVKRLLGAAIVLVLVLVVGYQVVVRLMINHKIENSRFLTWCQTLSVSDLEFATFSDPWQQEMFPENYILSEEEESRLVGMLNQIDTDNLSIEDIRFQTNPLFTVCVATEEGKFLFRCQDKEAGLFDFVPPTSGYDNVTVGRFNQLIVTYPELVDFVLEAAAKSDSAAAENT